MAQTSEELIIVTGASRGIGEAIARELAGPKRHMLLVARTEADLERVRDDLRDQGLSADYMIADLSSAERAAEFAGRVLEQYGPPHGLILNAGWARDTPLLEGDFDSVLQEIGVNILAPMGLLRALVPELRDRPDAFVVAIGSLTALVPFPGNATYAASKAAMLSLIRSARAELKRDAVHVGVVLPGYTDTAMTEGLHSALPSMTPEQVARAVRRCIEQRRPFVIPGAANRVIASLFGAFPELGQLILEMVGDRLVPRPEEAG